MDVVPLPEAHHCGLRSNENKTCLGHLAQDRNDWGVSKVFVCLFFEQADPLVELINQNMGTGVVVHSHQVGNRRANCMS